MKIKFTNSAIYRYENKFGSIQSIDEDAGISVIVNLAYYGWDGWQDKEGNFDEFLKEIDKISFNKLNTILNDAILEAYDQKFDTKGN